MVFFEGEFLVLGSRVDTRKGGVNFKGNLDNFLSVVITYKMEPLQDPLNDTS